MRIIYKTVFFGKIDSCIFLKKRTLCRKQSRQIFRSSRKLAGYVTIFMPSRLNCNFPKRYNFISLGYSARACGVGDRKGRERASVSVICEGTGGESGRKMASSPRRRAMTGAWRWPCSGDAKNTSEEFKAGGNSRAENSIIVA